MNTTATACSQVFPGRVDQAAKVREWIASLVGRSDRLYEITLCVSELAANAALHTQSGSSQGTFEVSVLLLESSITITVADQGEPLVPKPRRPADESGRGLDLVEGLADRFERVGTKSTVTFNEV